MGRLKGQVSPDFAMSAMIFSLAVLFVFFHLTRTYYGRIWEASRVESTAAAQNLAVFLTSEQGNWSANPFESSSIPFGSGRGELNTTRLQFFVGMPYQTVQDRLQLSDNFLVEVWQLPGIGITSDVSELYTNDTVDLEFQTTVDADLKVVLVGTQGASTGLEGYANWDESASAGRYHSFSFDLPSGVYSLKALATSGDNYGAYEASFRVVS